MGRISGKGERELNDGSPEDNIYVLPANYWPEKRKESSRKPPLLRQIATCVPRTPCSLARPFFFGRACTR